MSQYLGIVGTLLGALVGGLIAVYVSRIQYSRQRRLESDKRKIEKLEQIYELFSRVSTYYEHTGMEYIDDKIKKSKGEVIRERYDLSQDGHRKDDFSKLKMLVSIYAPTASIDLDAIDKAGGLFATVQCKEEVTIRELLDAYGNMTKSMTSVRSAALKKVVSIAESVNAS